MHRPINKLKGVGPAKAKALNEIGIDSIGDLLHYFPRRYLDRSITETTALQVGSHVTLAVRVVNSFLAHGRMSRLMVHCSTPRGEALNLVFFKGAQYFKKLFEADQTCIVSGKLDYYRGMQMAHPDFEFLDDEDTKLIHVGRIVPMYPSTDALKKSHLDSRGFRRLISVGLQDEHLEVPEALPPALVKKYAFLDRATALQNLHFPENDDALQDARRRLIYEELFLFHHMMYRKRLIREQLGRELTPSPFGESAAHTTLIARLPFQLTGDQIKAIEEILRFCAADHSEAFLLQGDVGSGKTVVALAGALHYMENGIQVALMAPTEVLARQHFRTLSDLIGLQGSRGIELVTGQDRKKARAEALDRIIRGESNLIVGTHSLIEEPVQFHSLGLVIIDEQHRFGVEQRETLRRKGKNPDLIAMTATPIPRTLCLTGFADLRLVTLHEKPAGRKPVKTMRLEESRRNGMYKSIRNHVSQGRQCFIVYPVIEESEKLDLRAAKDAFEELKTAIFPDFSIELLHGRLRPAEKERAMGEFRAGRAQILVTTTVIEVGVDVPNATIMVIEHADRFGISQLHQLRGRVGRGLEESFCALMIADDIGEDAARRLKALEESHDGFYLAETDMAIRGPGELLGLRQHGLPGFRLADLVRDGAAAESASHDVHDYPEISEAARALIRKQFTEGAELYPVDEAS